MKLLVDLTQFFSSVQFISASQPSTKYFIRNTGTGSDGHSCHLRHCPHKFTQNNKIQMKHHSKKTTKNIHSKDSYSAGQQSSHKHVLETLPLPKVHSKLYLETLLLHWQALQGLDNMRWHSTYAWPTHFSNPTQKSNKQINNWKMRHVSN